MFTLQRVEGKLFAPMAWTLSFAILGSMVYSITMVPVLASYLLKVKSHEKENWLWSKIQQGYDFLLNVFIRNPRVSLASFVFIILVFLGVGKHLGTEFLPELDEGCIWVRVNLPAGISLEAASKYPEILRAEIVKFDEVKGVLTQLGRTDDGTDPFGPNRIESMVQLKQPYSVWKSKLSKGELVMKIKKRLEQLFPGASLTITQPIIDMVTENATGSSSDLAIFIKGKNIDTLRNIGERVLSFTQKMQGASETAIEQERKQSQLVVEVDRASAARYGVNVSDVNAILEMAIGGLPVSSLWEEERKFDIVLRFTQESRNTPEEIGQILIQTKTGLRIPLSQVAKIRLEEGQSVICRDRDQRQITVKTNIRGRDQGSFAKEVKEKIESKIKLPTNYSIDLGGQFENLERSNSRLMFIVPITLLLILVVLLFLFNYKFSSALIVMTNIPLAICGGVIALYLRGMNFSISAGVGFVSLSGICIMSGILLVSYLNRKKKHKNIPFKDIVINGSIVQFRPRFSIMLIAIIGMLPAAMNTGVGSDVQRPLATVIVGGLTTSLLFSVFVLPLVYYLSYKKRS